MRMKIQVEMPQKCPDGGQIVLLSSGSSPGSATQVAETQFSAGRGSTRKLQPESAVHPGKSTNMGTREHAGCARLRDGT